ncbi:MAG: CotH kinase family protein [Chitinophagales bacterium]|nr:CotH kinase family protein [Chitinophagales bacterium]
MITRLLLICAAAFSFQIASAQVVINEISSRGEIIDETGYKSDWIEIYNAGASPVNIFNYGLSDDPLNPLLWKFPDIMIAPNSYEIVLANGTGSSYMVNHYETAIFNSDTWKYFIGGSEPPSDWRTIAFDDDTWSSGTGSIGYGDGDDGTEIVNTASVYLRKKIIIDDTSEIGNAWLHVDYDDAFVAYLNGVEIARTENIFGAPPAYDATATYDHEAIFYLGAAPGGFEILSEVLDGIIVPGENVLTLQIHNTSFFSSDLTSNAWLSFGIYSSAEFFEPVPAWFPVYTTYNHTNFSVSNSGETIYLSNAAGEIIDEKHTGYLDTYHSTARIPNGSVVWCVTNETSPASSNNSAACSDGYEPFPIFNIGCGFYSGPQTIEITSASPDAIIRYTLDGSFVKETSSVYTDPLIIDTTCIVSAKCFSSVNKFPSKIVKNTYFLDEPSSTIPVISISADPGSFFNTDTGIYVFGPDDWDPYYPYYGANFWEQWQRRAHISYFDESGAEQFAKEMYIEIHGGWSRAEAQRSFRIDFKNELDGNLNYQLFPDDKPEVTQFNNFNLRNGGQHVWASKIQDACIAEVMSKTHLDYEAYYPCILYVNGEYWGVYEMREKADEHFAESNYGVDAHKVDLRNCWGTLAGSDTSFLNLYDWVMNSDPEEPAFYDGFTARIDVENYVDYYIAEIFFQNVDFGGIYWGLNNIKLWKENVPGGKWRHILYDMDGALGWFGENVNTNYINACRSPYYPSYNSEIFDRALDNLPFREYFVNRFADLINTIFLAENVQAITYAMKDQLYPEMERQIERWGQPYDVGEWEYYIDYMLDFSAARISPARGNIKTSFDLEAIRDIDLEVYPVGAGHIKINTIYPAPYPWNGKYFDGVPVTLTAIPNPGYTFDHWKPNDIIPAGSYDQSLTANLSSSLNFTAQFSGTAGVPEIIVSELNYNSDGTLNGGDWVELFNNGTVAIDMSGMKMYDQNDINYFEFPLGTIIEPETYLLITEDPALFTTIYPSIINPVGGLPFSFSNSGDNILINDLDGNEIVHFSYADSLSWPRGADGTGRTLELLNYDSDINDPANWFDGCMLGSPGTAYAACDADVIFSEINYKSNPDMNAGDWIEIWNTSGATIDITNWKFADDNDTLLYQFAAGTSLVPDERIVVTNDITAFHERHPLVTEYMGPFYFGLDGNGEELRLIDNHGVLQISVIYNDAAPWPAEADGGGKTLELTDATGKMNEAENWFAGCPEGSPDKVYDPDCGLEIQETNNTIGFYMYPNPALEEFNVVFQLTHEQLQHAKLIFSNASGSIIKEITALASNYLTIKKNNLNAGVYYLKLITDNVVVVKEIVLM